MNVPRFAAVAVALAWACSCTHKKTSPDELAAALSATGLHVENRGQVEVKPEWVSAEMGVDLVLDYEEAYQAVRFPSAEFARAYCDGGRAGVPVGGWCLEPKATAFRQETWDKVNQLRTR